MTNQQRNSLGERNVEQAIAALKRGSYLLKYGRRGKPKFCPFRLSDDETTLIWYAGKEEKRLQLNHVTRIIPGQRTEIFQRYPRPEKEYQSFSLIYSRRSLDVICKDKDEAEVWFIALRALISLGNCQKWRTESRSESNSSDSSTAVTQRNSQSLASSSSSDIFYEDQRKHQNNPPRKRLGRALSDFLLYSEVVTASPQRDSVTTSFSPRSYANLDDLNDQSSADTSRISFASAISSSSQGSYLEDLDSLCDVFIWGEGIGDGLLGGGVHRVGKSSAASVDASLPKALESSLVLDAKRVACGKRHAVLVTKRGDIFSWGEGSGGRLGHGVGADLSDPKLIESLSGVNIESVACGEYHTCAVTQAGHLYTWGDGIHNFGLLGHDTKVGHWIPKRVTGPMEGVPISFVSCGPWHSAAVTSLGQLFTFGDGTFGALGHGDRESTRVPREVETLKGLRTLRVSCGFWHSAAVVDVLTQNSGSSSSGKLFTWGSGDQGQLGHGDKDSRLVAYRVAALNETSFSQVACGHSLTVALTTSGQVYTMGNADYGQIGNPGSTGKLPTRVQGKIKNSVIQEIACGSHHVAVLSSKSEVYTWGRGENGQLGHGDNHHRNSPTLVEALKDKRVKSVVCGNNFTAAICHHKQASIADHSVCSGCRSPFNFILKRHNCYNCGLVFCKSCSSKKSIKASLAPNTDKPYRVCDYCFSKLNKDLDVGLNCLPPKACNGNLPRSSFEAKEKVSSEAKPQGILSRLSSFDSFRRSDSRLSRKNWKIDPKSGHVYPICSRDSQCSMSYTASPTSSPFDYMDKMSISVPASTKHSRSASPLSVKSSPSNSMSFSSASPVLDYPELTMDESNNSADALTKEISILREQVEVLTRKSQSLEAELERTSRQLKEATDLARDEAEKNLAAKEVVKSLMMQLKDVAVRAPPGTSLCRKSDPFAENHSTLSLSSTWSQLTS